MPLAGGAGAGRGLLAGGPPINSTLHRLDFPYTRAELEALFQRGRAHGVERGVHYDARSATWSYRPWAM
jgi:hypothetical protein